MSWDIYMKLLVKECAQDFVSYFLPGARFVGFRESQLQTRSDGSFDPREMRADLLIEVEKGGVHSLLSLELQAGKDGKIDERLLGYSYEATRLLGLAVLSCVIYLQAVSEVPQPPLERRVCGERKVIWFDYESLELATTPVEELRKPGLEGFLPLLLLCQDGARREVLEEVLECLQRSKRKELLTLTRFFAGKVFTTERDLQWVERRFAMLHEFLRDSWTFQQTLQEGREEGLERGLEQGLERGLVALRQNIEAVVQARFPALLALALSKTAMLTDLGKLQQIAFTVGTVRSSRELRKYLLALPQPESKPQGERENA